MDGHWDDPEPTTAAVTVAWSVTAGAGGVVLLVLAIVSDWGYLPLALGALAAAAFPWWLRTRR